MTKLIYEECRNVERAGVVVFYKGKILTVLGKVSNKWGLPKGELKDNESLLDGAIRELHEETGIIIDHNSKATIEPFFSTPYTHYFKFVLNDEFEYHIKIIDKHEIKKCKFTLIQNVNKLYSNYDLRFLYNNFGKLCV